jgi:Arc/MetJ family transcription regulator
VSSNPALLNADRCLLTAQACQVTPGKVAHDLPKLVYAFSMARTNIDIDDKLIRKARRLTRLKTKRQIVDKALELLVRSESRKAILRYYGSGIWKGDVKAGRRNRV